MTGKERVLAALRGHETDRLCWSPLICPYFISSLPEQGYDESTVPEAARLIGADVIERHVPTIRFVCDEVIRQHTVQEPGSEATTLATPVGSVTTVRKYSVEAHTWYISKYPIESAEDLKVYQYVMEHTHCAEDFDAFRAREKMIGEDGIATSTGPITPVQAFIQNLCGLQNTVYLFADHPDLMDACLHAVHQNNLEAYRLILEGPAPVIIDYEDTSSTSISPGWFDVYCAPFINEYARICHDAGKLFITHMCGKLKAFNDQIRSGRQDGIDSVCPPTTGDTWAHEARAAWGDDKAVIGGIEPSALARMTVAETAVYVRSVLEKMPTFRKFILSTGDATAYGTPVENLRCVTRVVAEFEWK